MDSIRFELPKSWARSAVGEEELSRKPFRYLEIDLLEIVCKVEVWDSPTEKDKGLPPKWTRRMIWVRPPMEKMIVDGVKNYLFWNYFNPDTPITEIICRQMICKLFESHILPRVAQAGDN